MVIFFIVLEVLGQVVDPLSEDRNLDFRTTRITFGAGKFLDQFSFTLCSDRHQHTFNCRLAAGFRYGLLA